MNSYRKVCLACSIVFALALCSCSHSDTKKLTNDAKLTGDAMKQTATDALDASKKAVDNAAADARKAANSDTAKDIQAKTERAAHKAVDKTKQAAQDAKDAIDKQKQQQ
jgi:hypothetical protein